MRPRGVRTGFLLTYLPSRDARPPGKVSSSFDDCCRFFHSRTVPGRLDEARGSESSPAVAPGAGCQLPPDPVEVGSLEKAHARGETGLWDIGSVCAALAVSRELKPAFPPKELDHRRIHHGTKTRVDAAKSFPLRSSACRRRRRW